MPAVSTADLDRIVQEVVAERGTLDRATMDESWRRLVRLIVERTELGADEALVRPLLRDIQKGMCDIVQYIAFPNDAAHTFPEAADRARLESYFLHAKGLVTRIRDSLELLVPAGEPRTWAARNLEGIAGFLDSALNTIGTYASIAESGMVEGSPVGVAFTTAGFKDLFSAYRYLLAAVLGSERERAFVEQFNPCMKALNETARLLHTPPDAASN